MEDQEILLKKIRQLTTKNGIYQHGKHGEPDPQFGYALEDQARALIVAHCFGAKDLEKIYLNFIIRAQNKNTFLNQYYYDDQRGFVEDATPFTVLDRQEAYGITFWALFATNHFQDQKIKPLVDRLCKNAYSWVSPRAIAAALLGLSCLPVQSPLEKELTEKMRQFYQKVATEDWQWFENYLTYANGILPWACWEISLSRKDKEMEKIADNTTKFLIDTCQTNGIPTPIGNQGWYKKGGEKAVFDQQPIDAAYMVCCLEKAYLSTKNKFYLDWAKKWWEWFWGNNINKISLIDRDGACYDSLNKEGVNLNQGAESNICFLMAFLAAKRLNLD
ncbi:MAG: hypothetical protein ACPLY7_00060 [Microgenomates group bacterium]